MYIKALLLFAVLSLQVTTVVEFDRDFAKVSNLNSIIKPNLFSVDFDYGPATKKVPHMFRSNILISMSGIRTPEQNSDCVVEKQLSKKVKSDIWVAMNEADSIYAVDMVKTADSKVIKCQIILFIDGSAFNLGDNLIVSGMAEVDYLEKKHDWCTGFIGEPIKIEDEF